MSYAEAGRVRWLVKPAGKLLHLRFGWLIERDGVQQGGKVLRKADALETARSSARFEWRMWNIRSEVQVMDRGGHWTVEGSTYGDDPAEIPG